MRADPIESAALRAIIYPLVQAELQRGIAEARTALVFVKVHDPNAYDARAAADAVWLFSATTEQRIQNLIDQYGWQPGLAAQLVRSSPERPLGEYAADLVLRSGGSPSGLWEEITSALRDLGWEQPAAMDAPMAQAVIEAGSEWSAEPDQIPRPPSEPLARVEAPPSAVGRPPTADSLRSATTQSPKADVRPSLGLEEIRLIGRRLAGSLLILLAIAYLTSWGLYPRRVRTAAPSDRTVEGGVAGVGPDRAVHP